MFTLAALVGEWLPRKQEALTISVQLSDEGSVRPLRFVDSNGQSCAVPCAIVRAFSDPAVIGEKGHSTLGGEFLLLQPEETDRDFIVRSGHFFNGDTLCLFLRVGTDLVESGGAQQAVTARVFGDLAEPTQEIRVRFQTPPDRWCLPERQADCLNGRPCSGQACQPG